VEILKLLPMDSRFQPRELVSGGAGRMMKADEVGSPGSGVDELLGRAEVGTHRTILRVKLNNTNSYVL